MNGASHALALLACKRENKKQHQPKLGDDKPCNNSSSLVPRRGTIEASVGLASVELVIFRKVVRFI